MLPTERTITPVERHDGIYVKRDDYAHNHDPGGACGSKVRQFMAMLEAAPRAPLVVGCSANSCQQVYVGDAVRRTGRAGTVVVPARAERTEATRWTAEQGVTIVEVRPGYRSVYMARAREIAREQGAVGWYPDAAIADTTVQTINTPEDVERVVVPVGSGLVAAGVIAGLRSRKHLRFLLVAVSTLAKRERVCALGGIVPEPRVEWVRHPEPYDKPAHVVLPDGSRLDPFYAAKVWPYRQPGDLFWITGCRPVAAMPK